MGREGEEGEEVERIASGLGMEIFGPSCKPCTGEDVASFGAAGEGTKGGGDKAAAAGAVPRDRGGGKDSPSLSTGAWQLTQYMCPPS